MKDRARIGYHPSFGVAAVTLAALVAASAFRSSTGVLLEPIEAEFGWSRATTAGAVSLNLVLYGLVAPFAAAVMERWGLRRVVTGALVLVAGSSAATVAMTSPWQLWVLWGLCIGIGTGAMALVFGAIVANRWFVTHRGFVTGVFSAATATGQLVVLPVIVRLADGPGWRAASLLVAAVAGAVALLVAALLHDRPSDRGLLPYGAPDGYVDPASRSALTDDDPDPADGRSPPAGGRPDQRDQGPARRAVQVLRDASSTRAFWALIATFWVCGWSTNGLIQTHFVGAAHDHGMPATTSVGLLALVGVFDVVGTLASGWLTDRVDPRWLLGAYYGFRGLSLLWVDAVLGPSVAPGLWVFIVFYGLDWVATVPPTVALCRTHFGLDRSAVVFGWVFASHMVGAGIGASVAGWIRTADGSYHHAWLLAGVL